VAIAVVDLLEVVEIKRDSRQRLTRAL